MVGVAAGCTPMFKSSQKAQTLRREEIRGHRHNIKHKIQFADLGGIDGLPCPWWKSSLCIDTARLDFYHASEIILKHKTGLPERASHSICSNSRGQSTARAYLAGLFEEPTIHSLLSALKTEGLC